MLFQVAPACDDHMKQGLLLSYFSVQSAPENAKSKSKQGLSRRRRFPNYEKHGKPLRQALQVCGGRVLVRQMPYKN